MSKETQKQLILFAGEVKDWMQDFIMDVTEGVDDPENLMDNVNMAEQYLRKIETILQTK